jgi:hypothetical protein
MAPCQWFEESPYFDMIEDPRLQLKPEDCGAFEKLAGEWLAADGTDDFDRAARALRGFLDELLLKCASSHSHKAATTAITLPSFR